MAQGSSSSDASTEARFNYAWSVSLVAYDHGITRGRQPRQIFFAKKLLKPYKSRPFYRERNLKLRRNNQVPSLEPMPEERIECPGSIKVLWVGMFPKSNLPTTPATGSGSSPAGQSEASSKLQSQISSPAKKGATISGNAIRGLSVKWIDHFVVKQTESDALRVVVEVGATKPVYYALVNQDPNTKLCEGVKLKIEDVYFFAEFRNDQIKSAKSRKTAVEKKILEAIPDEKVLKREHQVGANNGASNIESQNENLSQHHENFEITRSGSKLQDQFLSESEDEAEERPLASESESLRVEASDLDSERSQRTETEQSSSRQSNSENEQNDSEENRAKASQFQINPAALAAEFDAISETVKQAAYDLGAKNEKERLSAGKDILDDAWSKLDQKRIHYKRKKEHSDLPERKRKLHIQRNEHNTNEMDAIGLASQFHDISELSKRDFHLNCSTNNDETRLRKIMSSLCAELDGRRIYWERKEKENRENNG